MSTPINVRANPYYWGTKNLDGNAYRFDFYWNTYTEIWYMDITGLSNTVGIKTIALLPGKDLLAQFGYSDILGQLWVIDNQGANENPNFADIGSRWTLEYTPLTTTEPVVIEVSEIVQVPIYIAAYQSGGDHTNRASTFATACSQTFVTGQDVTAATLLSIAEGLWPGDFTEGGFDLSTTAIPDHSEPITSSITIAGNELATFDSSNILFETPPV